MVANRHFPKIILAVMAVAVVLCLLAITLADPLTELFGGKGVSMEYETKLFNTDEIIRVDIRMDEDEWNKMLSNAISEEYYVCDVVINGQTVKNVAIRPKGNTSLSAIAMDPDSDRYSLKLEFDHFVDGQTCYGLDKLILNNNYADATNMKEAVIYDMFRYLGADASLYNYAKVSVNGEYRGVYLALEGVEESFMLRNFGTQDGELYKPDTMEMGGGNSSDSSKSDSKSAGFGGMTPPSGGFSRGGRGSGSEDADGAAEQENGGSFDPSSMPDMGSMPGGFDPSSMPDMGSMPGGFDPSNMPDMGSMPGGFDPNNMPDMGSMPGGFDPSGMPDMGGFDPNEASADGNGSDTGGSSEKATKRSGRGGFSAKGGADLNYSGDELDSYSTIWEGEVTGTSKADRRRVVTALKNVSEGTELEKYLDVDNVLKYMAVHTFSVNMDSLSGSMAHNYYLYEYGGQLNIFPWDYNLSFGGMSMGQSGGAADMVNDAIDTPFSGTQFFDALLEDETYLAQYHAYLQQLVDEYVNGGRFDEVYQRIRSQIDGLVQTDPTAFYDYDAYQTAAQMLYDTVKLRAESIRGQLNGTIPATDEGQRADSSAFVDASKIDVKAMGQFNMGGFAGQSAKTDAESDAEAEPAADGETMTGEPDTQEETTSERSRGRGRFSMPEEFSGSDASGSNRQRPSFSGAPGQSASSATTKNLITFGVCLSVMVLALILAKLYKRRR